MSTPVPKTAALADRAARRVLVRDSLRWTGRGLAVGAGAGLILVGADRLAGGVLPDAMLGLTLWPYLLGIPAAIGAAAGLTVAVVRRWRSDRAALEVDRNLGLKERLSSALALASHPSADPGFEQLAIRDAETSAESIKLASALPVTLEWTWAAWPAVAAGAVALAMLTPRVQWRSPAVSPAAEAAQVNQAAADVRDATEAAREAVERTLADRGVMDVASTEQLKQLESLERELLTSKTGAGEARVKAAETLDSLADQLQTKAREDQAEHDALREHLADSETPPEGAASPLAEALRAGDMAGAQQAARDLLGKVDGMSEADRQSLARDLEKLAEQVKSAPTPEAAEAEKSSPGQPGEQSPDAQLPEPGREAASPNAPSADVSSETDPQRIREELEKKGVPPDQSQRLAEDIARENREKQAKEQAQRDAEQLKENLRDAAREAREPRADKPDERRGRSEDRSEDPADSQSPDGPKSQTGKPGKGEDPSKPGDQPNQGGQTKQGDKSRPGDQSKTGEKSGERAGDKPGDQSGQSPGQKPGADKPGGDKGESGSGERPEGQSPGSKQPGVKTPGAPSSTESQEGDKAREEQGRGEKPGEKPGNQPGDQPGSKPGDRAGEQPGDKPGDKLGNAPGDQPGAKPGDQKGNQPGNQPGTAPNDQPGAKPGTQPGGKQPGQEPGAGEGPSDPSRDGQGNKPGATPGSQPGTQPGQPDGSGPGTKPAGRPGTSPQPGMGEEGSSPDGAADPGADAPASPAGEQPGKGGGFQNLQRQLDQLAERQQNARQAPRISRSLRDRAQQLLDQASKEDREAIDRWAQEAAKERADRPVPASNAQPVDSQTELVDARESSRDRAATPRPDSSEHIIAEWFSNQGVDRSGMASTREMTEQIQQASEGAEQAIEQQTVPRRHSELIRRIFGRYTQRARGQEPPPPVDAPDAKPARGSGK